MKSGEQVSFGHINIKLMTSLLTPSPRTLIKFSSLKQQVRTLKTKTQPRVSLEHPGHSSLLGWHLHFSFLKSLRDLQAGEQWTVAAPQASPLHLSPWPPFLWLFSEPQQPAMAHFFPLMSQESQSRAQPQLSPVASSV